MSKTSRLTSPDGNAATPRHGEPRSSPHIETWQPTSARPWPLPEPNAPACYPLRIGPGLIDKVNPVSVSRRAEAGAPSAAPDRPTAGLATAPLPKLTFLTTLCS
jgi:hypothetical protein